MKNLILCVLTLFYCVSAFTQDVALIKSEGWLESAYFTWQPVESAQSYRVYYSGEGLENQPIDTPLIRDYGDYFRADILGLKPGNYTFSVSAVINDAEGPKSESEVITVLGQDRSGFSFSKGRVPGAYNADGTPKADAVVLYITENSKNTVSLDVIGANSNPCVGLQAILDGFKKGKDSRPLIIRLIGQIKDLDYLIKGDLVIENNNLSTGCITLEGVGDDAVADGWGIRIKNASNIEIRNLAIMNCNSDEGDNIGLQQDNNYIWIHHCDFFYGDSGSDSDQAKGDGALDCKRSTYVTFSYNHFWDTGKSNLLGLSEDTTEGLYITYHHNWYDHSDSRHPRVRFYSAHVYNNYYDGNAKYGVGATMGSSVFVEGNYFRNCKYPILTSMQGSDVYNESFGTNDYSNMPTFSKEDGGSIKVFNNYMTGEKRFVAYGDSNFPNATVDFDGIVVENRTSEISNTIQSVYGNNTYNNFDTDTALMYAYSVDTPEEAKTKVTTWSGRMSGGDFKWTFNNEIDDVSYAVNSELKAALKNYKTSLVAIQGDGESQDGGDATGEGGNVIAGDIVHNFTESGLESNYFVISGNLSDSKGTVYYEGLTLTQCLKIESATTISFSTDSEATFTMVFNSGFSNSIKINGVSYQANDGILTLTIPKGDYEITKADVANLYLMSLKFTLSTLETTEKRFKIYPNPVNDVLRISDASQIREVKLYSLLGTLIKTFKSNFESLDVSEIQSGTYVISIVSSSGNYNKVMIKQ
ncbi:T9SS type A sorting domain-containing protein [Formosa sp. S-31]|uniref:pectate lyase family protein n=1 Tax=Formosa sp. S-31 TaxID=2790949 RepID=UPI003EBEB4D5